MSENGMHTPQAQVGTNGVMKPTHILSIYPSQKSEMLFRASDGVRLGQRKNATVVFGEEPNACASRVFLDMECATKFLRRVADFDIAGQIPDAKWKGDVKALRDIPSLAVIEDRIAEGLIELPPDSIDFPQHGRLDSRRN